MTNYEKLVEALRDTDFGDACDYCEHSDMCKDDDCIILQAADSIERLVSLYEKAEMDATNLTGKLAQAEAEVERLKDSNEELREKQTYIDHYGDRWMTSAKDVPTAAYEHGYADGLDEAEAQLPKRGEWIYEDLDNFRKYKVTCPHCGAWYVGNYDAYDEPWDFNYCPHCGNICNQTNIEYENKLKEQEKEARAKMEVQHESVF